MVRIYNILQTNDFRKKLRRDLTKPEVILWSYLQGRKFYGLKFRRQHGIGCYIVDFYCPRLKLAIELDGGQHYQEANAAYDRERDDFIRSLNIQIIKIPNNELLHNKHGVLEMLSELVLSRGRSSDHPGRR